MSWLNCLFLTSLKFYQKSKLLDQLLEITSQVTGGPGNFPYSYDVLLPEVCDAVVHLPLLYILTGNCENNIKSGKLFAF